MSTEPLLIHPPPYLYNGRDPFGAVADIVPIGLYALAEYLAGAGFGPMLARLPFLGRVFSERQPEGLVEGDWARLLAVLLRRHPSRVVAIQCHWTQYAEGAAETARLVRRIDPDRVIVLGGVHAAALAEELLGIHEAIDAVVIGEGERPLEQILQSLAGRERARTLGTTPIPGVVHRPSPNSSEVVRGDSAELVPLSSLPPLRFDSRFLDPPEGARFVGAPIVRGLCPKPCSYCELNQRGLFGRKQAVLSETLEAQIECAAAAGVPLYLPENFIGARPLADVIRRLGQARARAPIYIDTHPDMLGEEALRALEALRGEGANVRLWLGLESGSESVRRKAGRRYDAARIFALRDRLLAIDVRPIGSFLIGLPGEGADEVADTRGWIERWNDAGLLADVFPALAFPGTRLRREARELGILLHAKTALSYHRLSRGWFAPLDPEALTHENGRLTRPDVLRTVLELRLAQRVRLGLPLTQGSLSLMGHEGAAWTDAAWGAAFEALEPYWPSDIAMSKPTSGSASR